MQIHLAKSDITLMAVDAVVNPANSLGIMGGGVSAALSRKGGPSIQKEAMSLAPIATALGVVAAAVNTAPAQAATAANNTTWYGSAPSTTRLNTMRAIISAAQYAASTVYA